MARITMKVAAYAGISFEILGKLAHQISDNQAADQLQKALRKLFKTIHGRTLKTG